MSRAPSIRHTAPSIMATEHAELNRQHFDKQAAVYEEKPYIIEWASKVDTVLQRDLPSLGADAACLDFGCGPGALSALLAARCATVVGLDTSPNMIERFNAKASTKGLANMIGITADVLHTDALVAQLSQRQLPHQYDLVISLMTPHHLDNIEAVTAALSKLLKPAGSIVFVDILKTDTSRLFHGHHAHHTVAHLGGFDKQYMGSLYEGAGLKLTQFISPAYSISKEVEVGEGVKQQMEFDAFMAVGIL